MLQDTLPDPSLVYVYVALASLALITSGFAYAVIRFSFNALVPLLVFFLNALVRVSRSGTVTVIVWHWDLKWRPEMACPCLIGAHVCAARVCRCLDWRVSC